MSLKSSLTLGRFNNSVNGWYQSLARAASNDLNLGGYLGYEGQIQNIADSGSMDTNLKVFPVVFHIIYDDIDLLRPNSNIEEVQFSVHPILEDINNHFSNTYIRFEPAVKRPNGETLTSPGANYIDGSEISQFRSGVTNRTKDSNTHTYVNDFVTVAEHRYVSGDDRNYGVTADYIYQEYQWNPRKYINIFLVTRLLSDENISTETSSKVVLMSENPWIAEMSEDESKFNCMVPFWAIGESWKNSINTNYNYSYDGSTSLASFKDQGGFGDTSKIKVTDGDNANTKVIVKALGHMLGLPEVSNLNSLIEEPSCPTAPCLWEAWGFADACKDCHFDTYNVSTLDTIPESSYNTYACDTVSNEAIYGNPMHNVYFNDSLGITPRFSGQQITRMHANCETYFQDESTGVVTPGILREVLNNASTVLPEFIFSCDTIELFGTNIESISITNTLGYNAPSRISEFEKLKNKISTLIDYDG
jgi:hypothetical protein